MSPVQHGTLTDSLAAVAAVGCVILSVSDRRPTDARRRVIADSGTVPTVHDDRRAIEKYWHARTFTVLN